MPSPEDLKGKILIKNKKLPPGKDDTFEDDSESEEDGNEQETKTKENDKRKKLSTVSITTFYFLCFASM